MKPLDELPLLEIYLAMLKHQNKFCSRSVRSSLPNFKIWKDSNSVLDAGSGPGAFAGEYEDLFDGKEYLGVDISPDFVQIARTRFSGHDRFKFELVDLMNFGGVPRDVTLLWAVLQHVQSTHALLSHLAPFTRKGFVILDTRPGVEFEATPSIPTLNDCFDLLSRESRLKGRNTDCLEEARDWARKNEWNLSVDCQFRASIRLKDERDNFFDYSLFYAEFMRKKFGFEIDSFKLIEDLEHWRNAEDASAANGSGQWLVLERPR